MICGFLSVFRKGLVLSLAIVSLSAPASAQSLDEFADPLAPLQQRVAEDEVKSQPAMSRVSNWKPVSQTEDFRPLSDSASGPSNALGQQIVCWKKVLRHFAHIRQVAPAWASHCSALLGCCRCR